MANQDIRFAAMQAGISLWKIAEKYGITDSSFSRLLRHELSADKKQKILDIIKDLKEVETH